MGPLPFGKLKNCGFYLTKNFLFTFFFDLKKRFKLIFFCKKIKLL